MTECNQTSFGFEGVGRREIVAHFDGGTISSDGGAFLLRQTDRRLNLLARLGECFLDGRNQNQVDHTIPEMLAQRVYGLALGSLPAGLDEPALLKKPNSEPDYFSFEPAAQPGSAQCATTLLRQPHTEPAGPNRPPYTAKSTPLFCNCQNSRPERLQSA